MRLTLVPCFLAGRVGAGAATAAAVGAAVAAAGAASLLKPEPTPTFSTYQGVDSENILQNNCNLRYFNIYRYYQI